MMKMRIYIIIIFLALSHTVWGQKNRHKFAVELCAGGGAWVGNVGKGNSLGDFTRQSTFVGAAATTSFAVRFRRFRLGHFFEFRNLPFRTMYEVQLPNGPSLGAYAPWALLPGDHRVEVNMNSIGFEVFLGIDVWKSTRASVDAQISYCYASSIWGRMSRRVIQTGESFSFTNFMGYQGRFASSNTLSLGLSFSYKLNPWLCPYVAARYQAGEFGTYRGIFYHYNLVGNMGLKWAF